MSDHIADVGKMVPDAWVATAVNAYCLRQANTESKITAAIAAIAPLIRAAERERCAAIVAALRDEVQHNIAAIAPLIRAAERDRCHEMAAMKTELMRSGAECADAMAQVATLRSTVAGLVDALEESDAALVDMLEHLPDGNWIADAAHETLTAAIARAKGDG